VLFFSVDRANTGVPRIGDFDSPITALTVGDLRHTGRTELIAISSSGWLRAIEFPSRNASSNNDGQLPIDIPPRVTYCQLLNANICAAHLIDIDNDGKQEMVVAMTDRVGTLLVNVYKIFKIAVQVLRIYRRKFIDAPCVSNTNSWNECERTGRASTMLVGAGLHNI
jgi:hypothetical protein